MPKNFLVRTIVTFKLFSPDSISMFDSNLHDFKMYSPITMFFLASRCSGIKSVRVTLYIKPHAAFLISMREVFNL